MDKFLTREESALDRLRSKLLIEQSGCTHSIVLNTYENKGCDWAAKLADIFARRMAKIVAKKNGEKDVDLIVQRQRWIRFTEIKSGNRHMHCVATLNEDEAHIFRKRAKHIWAKLARKGTKNGKLHLSDYTTNADGEHLLAWYNTKENKII